MISSDDRDALLNEIKKDIEGAVNKINSFEKKRLLGALGGFLFGGVKHTRPALPNILETSLEYALSIVLASENDSELPLPSAEDTLHLLSDLEAIREKYIRFALTEDKPKQYTSLEQSLRSRVIEKTLTVRGEGYRIHVEEIFLELFAEHTDVFLKYYGFDPEAILETIDYIEDGIQANQQIIKEEHREFLSWFSKQDSRRLANTYGGGDPFLPSKVYQLETGKQPRFKSVDDQFRFNEADLSPEEQEVIKHLALRFGDNSKFIGPPFEALPLSDTLISSRPILYDEEGLSFYCFSTKILHRNLFDIAEEMLKNANNNYFNDVYLGKGKKGRSTYFEDKVINLIKQIIPNHPVHPNLKYKIGKEEFEIDVIGDAQEHIYLVEVKSGLYSNEAKRGAIRSLKNNIKDFVGDAAFQAERAEKFILSDPAHSFYYKNGTTVTLDQTKTIVKIVVSFPSIVGVTNQLYNLTELGIIKSGKSLPLGVTVYDLMALADIFRNDEQGFLNYIWARLAMYQEPNLKINNEMDFLGLYLSRDFKKVVKAVGRESRVEVDSSYRNKLDNYFKGLFLGQSIVKPKKIT